MMQDPFRGGGNGIAKQHFVCSVLCQKTPSRFANQPETLCGVLSKKNPSRLPCPSSHKRFFKLQRGVLYWSTCASSSPKGWVNFSENPFCEVRADPSSGTRFMLIPADGQWRRGNFTGVKSGRVFVFDAVTDSPNREDWLLAFRKHIAYGNTQFLHKTKPATQVPQNRGYDPQDTAEAVPPVSCTRVLGQTHQADQKADPVVAAQTMAADQKLKVLVTLSDMNKNTIDVMWQHGFSVEHIVKAYGPAKQQHVRDYLQPNVYIHEDQERVSTCQPP